MDIMERVLSTKNEVTRRKKEESDGTDGRMAEDHPRGDTSDETRTLSHNSLKSQIDRRRKSILSISIDPSL